MTLLHYFDVMSMHFPDCYWETATRRSCFKCWNCALDFEIQAILSKRTKNLTFRISQASQQGTIFGVATQHLLHLAADRRVYLMLILHLRVSSSDSSEVERLASILGDPRSIPPISKNIFVGNWAWFGLAILLSNSASSQNKAPCWEVW